MKVKKRLAAAALILVLMAGLCSCGSKKPLSQKIIGEWEGKMDVAAMVYKELSTEMGLDELGIEFTPDPIYCDISIDFNEDGTYVLEIDTDDFVEAVGECAEPYTSMLFGFDTSGIVDMIMQYVAGSMPVDTGRETGVYEVDDDYLTVDIYSDNGASDTFYLNDDGKLELGSDLFGEAIVFSK